MQDRTWDIAVAVPAAIAFAAILFCIYIWKDNQERRAFALSAIELAQEIKADDIEPLARGLTALREGKEELAVKYLELLLRTKMKYLKDLQRPLTEFETSELQEAEAYFERYGNLEP